MKIVYCLPQVYRPGGIERIVSIKANYLAEKYGHEVIIITACQQQQLPYYQFSPKVKFIDLNVDYDSLLQLSLITRILRKFSLQRKHKRILSKLLLKIKPDITISTFTHEAPFLPDIKDGSKKILEFHFCRKHKQLMANAFHFSFLTKIAYYLKCWQEENIIIPKYDQFVVLTEEDKQAWLHKISNVKCIPNIHPFETNEQAKLENKRAIAVGRLDAQKGFDKLIKVWSIVYKSNPDWVLDIYGQGEDEKQLKEQIKNAKLENVISINPPTSDIKDKYLNSSLFIMTSRYEGLPMTLLEATSLGLPAICFNFTCGPQEVIINNQNGYIIENDQYDKMALKIGLVLNNFQLRKQLGNNAKKLSNKFSSDIIMKHWNELFQQILEY